MIPATLVSVAVPLAFLALVRRQDLFASGSFTVVVGCFLWGLAAFAVSYVTNTAFLNVFTIGVVLTVVAPIVEEVVKSLALVYFERRPDFTYFVDGAIYGFAAGTAFAIIENLYYMMNAGQGLALGLSVNRAFSTSLMHGSTSALVGVGIGRLRYGRGSARVMGLVLGWAAAMAVHLTFNRMVSGPVDAATLYKAVLIGLGGVVLTVALILWGLREERAWLRESLQLDVGVSAGESEIVQRMADLDALLAPVETRFGAMKREQVEAFLRLQARLGLKSKAHELTSEPDQRSALAEQVADLQGQVDDLRREVGVYCMLFVRSILPSEAKPLWGQLEEAIANAPVSGFDLWGAVAEKAQEAEDPDERQPH